ncbi:MAG: helix-hairpin-helix domain-containing protein [Nitrososphaeraceae archaeon]
MVNAKLVSNSSVRSKILKPRPANAYGILDSVPFYVLDLNKANKEQLIKSLQIPAKVADSIISLRQKHKIDNLYQLKVIKGITNRYFEYIMRKTVLPGDNSLHILNVTVEDNFVYSDMPFKLNIQYFNGSKLPVAIVSAHVMWAGEPFDIEQELEVSNRGRAYIQFNSEQTLPVGISEFSIRLYRSDGREANFRKSVYVLPSNPLSLSLAPAGATVTGTWSARGTYQASDTYLTECDVIIANGSTGSVPMNRRTEWKFWDGGIGGSLVESGTFNWNGNINVPGSGTWQGRIAFSSPRGSGIYNKYNGKEDMTIEIIMTAQDDRRISGSITSRVMLAYGVNIIKVGNFASQEGLDLYSAVDITRQIYEKRDITFRGVLRWIIDDTQAGGLRILDSETEFRNLLSSWSVPNDYIDVFVCQDFNWSTFNGYAGDIPGPSSKGGDKDGVAVDKTGYSDGSGIRRLNIDILSKLIGHEVGHYLGLSHVTEANNLMLSDTGVRGPDLTYDQYRLMLPHGYLLVS